MKLGFSQQEIERTAVTLRLPSNQSFINRRIARAFDLVNTGKVTEVTDGIFRVRSQYEPDKIYLVNLNHGEPSCDCPDGERTINCKHRIASLLYMQKQQQAQLKIRETTEDVPNPYLKRSWFILENGNRCLTVVEELNRLVFCNCGAYYDNDCIHKQAVIKTILNGGNGNRTKRNANECGSKDAKALQDKLNAQIDSRNGNGNGAENNVPTKLDLSNPFEEAESYDIDQIEGRRNGEVTWKLRNGEVVISYKGVMTLAEKHHITFDEAVHSDTYTVIAKGCCGTSERVSGKPINGNVETAIELAKRNAARQLLPYAELRAVEKKAQLESEFNWQKAKAKCVELVGEANFAIIIHELVKDGKLRMDNPSHYNRTEWLMIYDACKRDVEVERDPVRNAHEVEETSMHISNVPKDISNGGDPKSLSRWSYNSAEFLDQCREAINQVRESKKAVETNEQPSQSADGKRRLQMTKDLRTWLVESDGSKKEISCREICETFESKQNPSIVTRLRAGIDSGADFSTVDLN